MKKIAENLNKPRIEIRHDALKRVGDSIFKSECPFCETGILPVSRNQKTYKLIPFDICLYCAQRVEYLDFDDMLGVKEEKKR